MSSADLVVLRAGGCSLLLDASGPLLPRVLHWGADLGAVGAADLDVLRALWTNSLPHSSVDEPLSLTVLPAETEGW